MKFHTLKIKDLQPETSDALVVTLEKPEGKVFNYKAGQYLTFKVFIQGKQHRRAYSLCSSPNLDSDLQVCIKKVPNGLVSNFVSQTWHKGDTIEVLPPNGNFCVETEPNRLHHYILIAGGSGITPIFSILRTVLDQEHFAFVTLIYANINENSIIFGKWIDNLQLKHKDRFSVHHILENPIGYWQGLIGRIGNDESFKLLKEVIERHNLESSIYLCGPSGMMETTKQLLEKLKYPKENIFTESFGATKEIEGFDTIDADNIQYSTQQVKVILDGMPHTLTVKAGQTILDAAIEAHLDPPYACQEGSCSTCRASLHSGKVHLLEREGLSDQELKQGYILTCQSHPLSNDVEIEFG